MNTMKWLALFLLFGMASICVSCVEDEQAPYSGEEDSGFYVQMPGYGEFYIGSEVVLKGNRLSEITNVYVLGAITDSDEEDWGIGNNGDWSGSDQDGVFEDSQLIEANIVKRTETELTFVLPVGTTIGRAMVCYKRGGELKSLNILNNIIEPLITCLYDEAAGCSIVIDNIRPSADDKVYMQGMKYDSGLGEMVPATDQWREAPVLFSDEHSLTVGPAGIGEMRVLYVHGGDEMLLPSLVNVYPEWCVRFSQDAEYREGDEVTITGGFFEEEDMITLNGVLVDIVSIDTVNDTLTFRIPQGCTGVQQVYLYRYLLEYFVAEIYVQERI